MADRQTDRHTDRQTDRIAVARATLAYNNGSEVKRKNRMMKQQYGRSNITTRPCDLVFDHPT